MRRISVLLIALFTIHLASAEVVELDDYRGWDGCYSIRNSDSEIIICPAAGGRLLCYSIGGENIIFENHEFDGILLAELKSKHIWPDGGRFDIGPEAMPYYMRDELMMGAWEATPIDGYCVEISFKRENSLGLYVTRRFELSKKGAELTITQTMTNYTDQPVARHYWGRVFCKGGGVIELPLDSSDGWGPMGGHSAEGAKVDGGKVSFQLGDTTIRKVGSYSRQGCGFPNFTQRIS